MLANNMVEVRTLISDGTLPELEAGREQLPIAPELSPYQTPLQHNIARFTLSNMVSRLAKESILNLNVSLGLV